MTKCPDCGEENVPEPEGYVAHCGRRILLNPSDDWRERMRSAHRCKEAADRRKQKKDKNHGRVG